MLLELLELLKIKEASDEIITVDDIDKFCERFNIPIEDNYEDV